VDLESSFGDVSFSGVYGIMKEKLNISKIKIIGDINIENDFPYTLESSDWKQIQMEGLKSGH
jgi:hypothetical protein